MTLFIFLLIILLVGVYLVPDNTKSGFDEYCDLECLSRRKRQCCKGLY
jgi:hypothetical protein